MLCTLAVLAYPRGRGQHTQVSFSLSFAPCYVWLKSSPLLPGIPEPSPCAPMNMPGQEPPRAPVVRSCVALLPACLAGSGAAAPRCTAGWSETASCPCCRAGGSTASGCRRRLRCACCVFGDSEMFSKQPPVRAVPARAQAGPPSQPRVFPHAGGEERLGPCDPAPDVPTAPAVPPGHRRPHPHAFQRGGHLGAAAGQRGARAALRGPDAAGGGQRAAQLDDLLRGEAGCSFASRGHTWWKGLAPDPSLRERAPLSPCVCRGRTRAAGSLGSSQGLPTG